MFDSTRSYAKFLSLSLVMIASAAIAAQPVAKAPSQANPTAAQEGGESSSTPYEARHDAKNHMAATKTAEAIDNLAANFNADTAANSDITVALARTTAGPALLLAYDPAKEEAGSETLANVVADKPAAAADRWADGSAQAAELERAA